jgi:hypothetical protein
MIQELKKRRGLSTQRSAGLCVERLIPPGRRDRQRLGAVDSYSERLMVGKLNGNAGLKGSHSSVVEQRLLP